MSSHPAIDEFVSKLNKLHEVEYGDFKRKLSCYFARLEDGIGGDPMGLIRKTRQLVIFEHQGDIESSRRKALNMAEQLKVSGDKFTH